MMDRDTASLDIDDREGQEPKRNRRPTNPESTASGNAPQRDSENGPSRDDTLRAELEKVRAVNKVVEKVIHSLERSTDNMQSVHQSVSSASSLLDVWTKILAQTEHTQRLLLHPEWRGASQDMEDIENESVLRQQEEERRSAEEEIQREAAARHRDEEERKRASVVSASSRGARGRGRGLPSTSQGAGRGASSSTSTVPKRTISTSRAGSGIGRGFGTTRGRGRGT